MMLLYTKYFPIRLFGMWIEDIVVIVEAEN